MDEKNEITHGDVKFYLDPSETIVGKSDGSSGDPWIITLSRHSVLRDYQFLYKMYSCYDDLVHRDGGREFLTEVNEPHFTWLISAAELHVLASKIQEIIEISEH